MKIKKRILVSSTLMVLLALLALLFIGSFIIHKNLMHENSVLRNFVVDPGVFEAEKALSSAINNDLDITSLKNTLDGVGFKLLVMERDTVICNSGVNLPNEINNVMEMMDWDSNVHVLNVNGYYIAGIKKQDYKYVAVKENFGLNDIDRRLRGFLRQFLTIGVMSILVILAASQIFANYLAKRILTPIAELNRGARRIEEGNLSEPVVCRGEDEFSEVCNAFNHMQSHLQNEKEKTAAYEKSRIDLVAGISHDLRTPLTSIKGYVKGLRDGVANTPEKQEQYLEIAYRKTCDMESLLQQLFYFSGIETGNLPVMLEKIELQDIVRQFEADYGGELKQKNGILKVECSGSSHPVMADIIQMNRVFLNLMENSMKYAGVLPLIITITLHREADYELVCFADNGKGVTTEQLSHLFDRFWRADEARSTKNGEGTGLGLYIVKYIMKAHGGYVRAVNDNGLKIILALPHSK